jgi:hypothetical protein
MLFGFMFSFWSGWACIVVLASRSARMLAIVTWRCQTECIGGSSGAVFVVLDHAAVLCGNRNWFSMIVAVSSLSSED